MTFPFLNSLGFDIFPLTGNIGSHTKFGLRTAGFQDILQHLVVYVGNLTFTHPFHPHDFLYDGVRFALARMRSGQCL